MKQMAAAAVRKMRCCKRSSLLVVTLDCNGLRIFLSLEIDDRNFQIMKLFNLHIAACHHNAGYTVGDEHIEIFGFFLRLIFRVAEQNLVAIACVTFFLVSSLMYPRLLITRETVVAVTPARAAMSLIVAMFLSSSFSNCFSLSPIIAQKICFR